MMVKDASCQHRTTRSSGSRTHQHAQTLETREENHVGRSAVVLHDCEPNEVGLLLQDSWPLLAIRLGQKEMEGVISSTSTRR